MTETVRVEVLGSTEDLRRALKDAAGNLLGFGAVAKDTGSSVDRSMRKAGDGFDDMARKGKRSIAELKLALQLFEHQKATAQVDVDVAKAEAKIRLIKREIRSLGDEEARVDLQSRGLVSSLEKVAGAAGGGGSGAGGASGGAAGAAGGLPGILTGITGAAIVAAPALLGLAGAITAVAGSLGAAVAGLGVLGAGGIGALAAGLGSVAAVAIPAAKEIGKVQKAQEALDLATKQYGGKTAPQVVSAQNALKMAMAQYGGKQGVAPQVTAAQQALSAAVAQYGNKTAPQVVSAQGRYNAAVQVFGANSARAISAHKSLDLAIAQYGAKTAPQIIAAQTRLNTVTAQYGGKSGVAPQVAAAQAHLDAVMKVYGGKTAPQVTRAQDKLNAVIAEAGGPKIAAAAKGIENLGEKWMKLTKPGQQALAGGFADAIKAASDMLPAVAKDVNDNVKSFVDAFATTIKMLQDGGLLDVLHSLSDTFQHAVGPAMDAVGQVMIAFGNVAQAAGPYVVRFADGVDRLATGLRNATDNSPELKSVIGGLMGQLQSWVGLLEQVGGLLFDVLGAGAPTGKGIVDSLTGVLKKWHEWMNTKQGQDALRSFFKDSRELLKALGDVLFPAVGAILKFVRDAMPAFTDVLKALKDTIGWLNRNIPNFVPMLGEIAVAGGLVKALKIVQAMAGVKALKKMIIETAALSTGTGGAGAAAGAGVAAKGAGKGAVAAEGAAVGGEAGIGFAAGLTATAKVGLKLASRGVLAIALLEGLNEGIKASGEHLSKTDALREWVFKMTGGVFGIDVKKQVDKNFSDIAGAIQKDLHIPKGAMDWHKYIAVEKLTSEQRNALNKLADFQASVDAEQKALDRNHIVMHIDSKPMLDGARDVTDALDRMRGSTSTSVGDLETNVRLNMRLIRGSLGSDSAAGKQAIEANFAAAIQNVQASMAAGSLSVKDGMALITKYTTAELKQFGFSQKQASMYLHGLDPVSGKPFGKGTSLVGKQRGGLVTIGHAGDAGPDRIPMNVGGQAIMAGSGEDVAVINRHQRAVLDTRLADMGGLSGLFSRVTTEHSQPRRFGIGGMVTAADRLEAAHFPYKWGGGHQASPAPFGPVDCSGAVSFVLQHGGVQIPTETSGQLMAAGRPGPGVVTVYANPEHTFMSLSGRFFGTSATNPQGGAGWMDRPAGDYLARFTQRHFGTGGADTGGGPAPIKAPRTKVPGDVGAIAQLSLDEAAGAVNSRFQQIQGTFLPGVGNVGDSTGLSGSLTQLVGQIAGQRGWSAQDWLWIISHESGGRADAKNPNSTAFGIGQLLDTTSAIYGGGPGSSMAQQVVAMAGYIAARYHNPTVARRFWEANHYYGTGGIIEAAGGLPPSTRSRKRPPNQSATHEGDVRAKSRKPRRVGTRALVEAEKIVDGLAGSHGMLDLAQLKADATDEQQLMTVTDAQGNQTQIRDEAGIRQHLKELTGLIGIRDEITGALRGEQRLAKEARRQLTAVVKAQVEKARRLRDRIRANIRQLRQLRRDQAAETKRKTPNKPRLKAIGDSIKRLEHENMVLGGSTDQIGTGGQLGHLTTTLGVNQGKLPDINTLLLPTGLPYDIQANQVERGKLATEYKDWSGTVAPPSPISSTGTDNAALLALVQQQRDDALHALTLQTADFDVLEGFMPLLAGRMVGSFAHGIDRVQQTGLAVIHKDETITPDPQGPYGSQMTSGGGVPVINLYIDGDAAPFMRRVRAEIDGRAAKVVSQQVGARSRAIVAAPGGR